MQPREHYVQQLQDLHTELHSFGQITVTAVMRAIIALKRRDVDIARCVVDDDEQIDQAQYTLENHAISVIATQQPVASDLRRLIAVIAIASELERIADYAKGIAKIVVRNAQRPPVLLPYALWPLAALTLAMLSLSIEAFARLDTAATQRLAQMEADADELTRQLQARLITRLQHEPANGHQLADLLVVVHNLERIADRTTNIAERLIYVVSGNSVNLNP